MSEVLPPEDVERLERLFARAAELPPDEQRALVDRECAGNDALRAELEFLLAGHEGPDRVGAATSVLPSRIGTRIGPYELLERLGEGGMGEVYLAEQTEPVRRRVALKLIKAGMDTAQVVARFEAERQALARMSHPSIARVLEAGATDEGLPYFVMELVEGVPITEFCDGHRLTLRERLALFAAVCDGVQHAHQKGVVHRDLKPSNLLVSQEDGHPAPKVIDFGIARATTGRLSERSLHTSLGQIVGTLDYMSPEQADPSGSDVDTRSDIYSLGVVLYQLASGLLPFEHSSAEGVQLSEVQRAIRETDPPTPSARLRRRTGTASTVAPLRGTDERTLLRQLKGDLDWICLKALEKEPARRYASAAELADDVRRHLAHEPVLAGPPSTLYRARKFVRRNRVPVTAGALLAVGALAGVFGILKGRLDARASRVLAQALEPQAQAYLLKELEREADALWPARPERIPELERWVATASGLAADLDAHRARLAELRSSAGPWAPADRARARERHPRRSELEFEERELDAWLRWREEETWRENPGKAELNLEIAETRILALEAGLPALEAKVEARRVWFDSPEEQARQDVLRELVEGLDDLLDEGAGLLSEGAVSAEHGWSVPKRLAFARDLASGFAPGGVYDEAWSSALPEIREAYPGLDLAPQVGLLPLGPDPGSGLWEFVHLASGAAPVRGEDRELVMAEDTGVVLVLLPGGTFLMGAQDADPEGPNFDDKIDHRGIERGVHPVDVSPFFLSKYEMTQAQWERTTGENPSLMQLDWIAHRPTIPVNQVTWTDCAAVVARLGLELPTEEQWEYAARAGTTTAWYTGATPPKPVDRIGNLRGDNDGFAALAPVGSFPPNPFGLHDVLGNVTEWCSNHPYLYGPGSPSPEVQLEQTARGGNSRTPPAGARSAWRGTNRAEFQHGVLGLRPGRRIDP